MYSSINASDLKGLIGKVNIIDIRDSYLYRLGFIPTAKNIPMSYLLILPDKYLKKDDTYYIYCAYGLQSAKLCSSLAAKGYRVVNVLGGYKDYLE